MRPMSLVGQEDAARALDKLEPLRLGAKARERARARAAAATRARGRRACGGRAASCRRGGGRAAELEAAGRPAHQAGGDAAHRAQVLVAVAAGPVRARSSSPCVARRLRAAVVFDRVHLGVDAHVHHRDDARGARRRDGDRRPRFFFEAFFTLIFTVELLCRLLVAKPLTNFFCSWLVVVDVLSVAPFYVTLLILIGRLRAAVRVRGVDALDPRERSDPNDDTAPGASRLARLAAAQGGTSLLWAPADRDDAPPVDRLDRPLHRHRPLPHDRLGHHPLLCGDVARPARLARASPRATPPPSRATGARRIPGRTTAPPASSAPPRSVSITRTCWFAATLLKVGYGARRARDGGGQARRLVHRARRRAPHRAAVLAVIGQSFVSSYNVYINAHVATEMRRKVAAKIRRESRGQRNSGQERRSSENAEPARRRREPVPELVSGGGGDRADS